MCRFIIEHNQISHNQSLGVFTVVGTTGNAHAVRLFPKESCTCPSTNSCYHILAVRMSVIGLQDMNSKRKINLTQLRKNTRTRTAKRSGRKAPSPGDYDIKPAPDATTNNQHSDDNFIVFSRPSQVQDDFNNPKSICSSSPGPSQVQDDFNNPKSICSSSPGPSQVQDDFNNPKSICSSSPGPSQVQDDFNNPKSICSSSPGPSQVQDDFGSPNVNI